MDSLCTLDIILCWLHDINTYILHIILVYTAVFQICIFVYMCLYIERLTLQNGLKYGSFMPFVSERRSIDYEQLTTQAKFSLWQVPEALQDYDKEYLFYLLCNRSFDDKPPCEWMEAVEHYLWGSHLPPEVGAIRVTSYLEQLSTI